MNNLKNRGFKLLAGGMAAIFSYMVCSPVSAGYSSFPQIIENLDRNILESRTVSELSSVFGDAVTATFSIVKEDFSQDQEEERKTISEIDGAIGGFNLILADLAAQLEDLSKDSSQMANNAARTLMHEFYYNHLIKRFQNEPFKGLSREAKVHAFHLIKAHIEKGNAASFLKEVELMEDQTSQGFIGAAAPGAWIAVAIFGFIMAVFFGLHYSKEENSLSEDWAEFWSQVKKFFCE